MKNKKYITIPELAKFMGLSRIAVFKKVKKGQIKAVKIGRTYAIPSGWLDKIAGKALTTSGKKVIERAVKKTVLEYGDTLRLLGRE